MHVINVIIIGIYELFFNKNKHIELWHEDVTPEIAGGNVSFSGKGPASSGLSQGDQLSASIIDLSEMRSSPVTAGHSDLGVFRIKK